MTRGGYANYEAGTAPIPEDRLLVLRRMGFQVTNIEDPAHLRPESVVPIPYIGLLAASDPVKWGDPYLSDSFEYVPCEFADKPGRYCGRIDGDSMFDFLHPGDVVVFDPINVPRLTYVQLFVSDDSLACVKVTQHNGTDFVLRSINPKYPDVVRQAGEYKGVLVGILRKIGSLTITMYDPTGLRPS